jgi:hypothetical protein
MEYTKEIIETFDRILEKLDRIEKLVNEQNAPYVYPSTPDPYPNHFGGSTTCSKCGMEWKGVMGYVCSTYECPVQMQVTSHSVSYTGPTQTFNVESLDPDQRSWYYDGDGTKRQK